MPSKMFLVENVCCPRWTVNAQYDTRHIYGEERFRHVYISPTFVLDTGTANDMITRKIE